MVESSRYESRGGQPPDTPALARAYKRFAIVPADLLPLAGDATVEHDDVELDEDDADNAIGRTIARIDSEPAFATAYLSFTDGTYLTYAARVDEEGVILLDRFCSPAGYEDYWVFDDLEGESAPPPALPGDGGAGYEVESWRRAEGRTIRDLGWFEEGMQAFVHFAEGGYMTFGARAAEGAAYLLGFFSSDEPEDADGYVIFDGAEDLDGDEQ